MIDVIEQNNFLLLKSPEELCNLSKINSYSDTTKKDQSLLDLINKDTTKVAEATTRAGFTLQNPLFGILIPRVTAQGQPLASSMVGISNAKDTAKVNSYLKMNQIKALFPRDLKLLWSQNPYPQDPTKTMYELHAIKITTRDGRAPLGGDAITSARTSTDVTGNVKVDMSMNSEGSKTWARMTRENIGRCLVVVLDGYVRSYPRVQNEINGGSTEITGDFTIEEADDLANILKSGKLPAPSHIISDTIVGPTLGKEAINSGFISFFVAFALVLGFEKLSFRSTARNPRTAQISSATPEAFQPPTDSSLFFAECAGWPIQARICLEWSASNPPSGKPPFTALRSSFCISGISTTPAPPKVSKGSSVKLPWPTYPRMRPVASSVLTRMKVMPPDLTWPTTVP